MERSRNRKLAIIIALLHACLCLLFLSCSGRKTAFTHLPPDFQPSAEAAELKALADEAWLRRDQTAAAEEALQKYEAAYQANPGDTMVAIRRAEAYFFVAEYVMAVKNVKARTRERYFADGLSAGERALELHTGFRTVNRETLDEEKALAQLDGSWTPAVFWTYANMVRWQDLQNPLRKLRNEQRLEIYRQRLRRMDDEFYYGGVYRLSGVLGQGETDEPQFENAYEKALFIAKDFFSNHRVYAEKYAFPKNKIALADSLLKVVVNGDPRGVPENKYEQEIAANLLTEQEGKLAQKEESKRAFKPRY